MLVGEPFRPMVVGIDQRIVLQGVVVINCDRLVVAAHDALDGHVAGLVQLLDAGQQARGLGLDGHVAILQSALNGNGGALDLYVSSVGDLRDVQLLSDLRTNLSGITVDSLTAAEYYVISVNADTS